MSRPEYIRCIRHTHEDKKRQSWCGKPLASFDWAFTGIDHAAYNADQGGRLLACPECVAAVAAVFEQAGKE